MEWLLWRLNLWYREALGLKAQHMLLVTKMK